jgi:hypothetical protein
MSLSAAEKGLFSMQTPVKKELRAAEAIYALVFAICVLIALFLLTS